MPSANDKKSPAEKFFGRILRGPLPTLQTLSNVDSLRPHELCLKHAKFQIGDYVRLQNPLTKRWTDKGIITGIRHNGKSYFVTKHGDDHPKLRNIKFIKKLVFSTSPVQNENIVQKENAIPTAEKESQITLSPHKSILKRSRTFELTKKQQSNCKVKKVRFNPNICQGAKAKHKDRQTLRTRAKTAPPAGKHIKRTSSRIRKPVVRLDL
jgi:hypothetical protein